MTFSNSRNTSKALFAIFTFLTVSLCSGAYMLYLSQKNNITKEKHNELAAINKLKIEQIVNWRNNLLSDAKTIYYNQPVIIHINEINYLAAELTRFSLKTFSFRSRASGNLTQTRLNLGINPNVNHQTISEWTKSLLKEFDYPKALLVNPSDKVIFNTNFNEP